MLLYLEANMAAQESKPETLFEPTPKDISDLVQKRGLHLESGESVCPTPDQLGTLFGKNIVIKFYQLDGRTTRFQIVGSPFPYEGLREARWYDVAHSFDSQQADFRSQWAMSLGGQDIPEPIELVKVQDSKDMLNLYTVLKENPEIARDYSLPEVST